MGYGRCPRPLARRQRLPAAGLPFRLVARPSHPCPRPRRGRFLHLITSRCLRDPILSRKPEREVSPRVRAMRCEVMGGVGLEALVLIVPLALVGPEFFQTSCALHLVPDALLCEG